MTWRLTEEGFDLTKPYQYRPWVNFLSNPDYGMRISHLGDGYATTLAEPRRVITNYDFFAPIKGRFVFVKDGDSVWSPSFYPVKATLDSYTCRHAPGYTRWTSVKDGIEVESTVFLPLYGPFEVWKVRVRNVGNVRKSVSVFPQVEYHLYNSMGVDPVYYSWFTNAEYDQVRRSLGFFKTIGNEGVYGFFRSLKEPQAFETSLRHFCGDGDIQNPEAIREGKLHNSISGGDPYIGCFQFDLTLEPGEEWANGLFVGEGTEVLRMTEHGFNTIYDLDYELSVITDRWKEKLRRPEFDSIKDDTLRGYLQTFFPYQVYQQAEGLVRGTWRGYRDVAQDAMGLSYFDGKGARKLLATLASKQYRNGRCPRQWNTEGGANDERDFRDLPLWTPLAVAKYIENTGDATILEERVPWEDDTHKSTVFEHMVQGFKYVLRYGPHELIEIGIGDWNDALSGLGLKGESLWLNEFAYLALAKMKVFQQKYGHASDIDIDGEMKRLYKGVIKNWTGQWFARGYHENGTRIGGDERIFLLPQAWFTISGMAQLDPEKATIALDNMVERLRNPNGLLICQPGWDKYDAIHGNISALAPGLAENYAVYNHASAFGIYGLLMAGRNEEAVEFIKKMLPIYKDFKQTRSEPYVLVNYYNGGYYEYKAGEGGIPWLTGTVHWMVMSFFDHVLPKNVDIQ
jgi:cellobiose phosphorylase